MSNLTKDPDHEITEVPEAPEAEQGLISVIVGGLAGLVVGGPVGACVGIGLVAAVGGGKYISETEDGKIEITGIEHSFYQNGIEGFALETEMLVGAEPGSTGSVFAFFYDSESGKEIKTQIQQFSNSKGHLCIGEEFICDESITEGNIDLFIPYRSLADSQTDSYKVVVCLSLNGDKQVSLATAMEFEWHSENSQTGSCSEAGFESSEVIDAIVALAVAVIKVDGVVEQKEKDEFSKIFNDIVPSDQKQSEAMKASLANYFQSPVPVDKMIEVLVEGLDDHEKRVVLAFCMNLVRSDQTIHDKEIDLLKKIQSAFAVSDKVFQDMIGR